jgi:hypothetical protein
MKALIFFLITISTLNVYSQVEIKVSSISTDGGYKTVGNKYLLYTVGEVAVRNVTKGDSYISEGFIESLLEKNGLNVNEFSEINDITIFPNPVIDFLNIKFSEKQNYQIMLFSINGEKLFDMNVNSDEFNYSVSRLSKATYILIIVDNINKKKKIVKLEKL